MLAQRPRPAFTGTPNDGSRTITVLDVPTPEKGADDDDDQTFASNPRPVLKLRGGPRSKQRVAWKEEVIDNENCGRKKSKICCIYHKPKRFDESSDESSDESDDGRAKPAASHKTKKHVHNHAHDHGKGDSSAESSGSGSSEKQSSGGTVTELERPVSPNAYEVQPKRS